MKRKTARSLGGAKRRRRRYAGLAVGVGAVTAALGTLVAGANPIGCVQIRRGVLGCPTVTYQFKTLNDQADPTFNQLLGVNMNGSIAGYFGSGAAGHPNKGYKLKNGQYQSVNFPGSAQTQVTGINTNGVLVGFASTMNNADMNNDNFSWYKLNGSNTPFQKADFPTSIPSCPPLDQLLGVNNNNVAVGFFTDADGNDHGYTINLNGGATQELTIPTYQSLTATAINDNGDIVGFGTTTSGVQQSFLKTSSFTYPISYPNASSTMALGVNNNDEVVGVATIGSGDNAVQHGFTWYPVYGFQTVDDPNGQGTTTINGVSNCGDLVGFYVDSQGNTDGMLANAQFSQNVTPVMPATGTTGATGATNTMRATADALGAHRKKAKKKAKLPKGC